MARIAVLAALILSLGVFASCGKRRAPVSSRPNTEDTARPVDPVIPQPSETVSFRGEGYFSSADLPGVGLESDSRLGSNQVVYDMYGAFHRYRFLGDLEVMVLPCSSGSAASTRSDEERANEQTKQTAGMNMNRVKDFKVQPESIVGSNSWWAWAARAEGRLVIKVGFASGPYYVSVLWDDSGGESKVPENKEKAVRAAKYIAGKLGR